MIKYKFCPNCGDRIIQRKGIIECKNCHKTTYLHSSATGSVFVIKEGKVLLGKRADEPAKGYWDIPGGFLNLGEHPKVGAIRELSEETSTDIKIIDLLGVYMDKYEFQGDTIPTLNSVYIGEIKSGKPKAQSDVATLKWFDINKPLPRLAFKMVREAFYDLRKWYKDNGRGGQN